MASISLLTGPMGLLADRPAMQMQINSATTATTITSPPPSACPSSTLAYRCHRSAVRTWSVAASVVTPLAFVIVVLADGACRLALKLASAAANSTAVLAMAAWACRRAERLRNKLYFEMALVLLGPGGSLLLVVLWPGWIVLAVVWALWAV